MLEKLKNNKLPVLVVTLMFAALAVGVYYVNFVHIPAKKAALAEAIAAERAAEEAAQRAEEEAALMAAGEADEDARRAQIIQEVSTWKSEQDPGNSFAQGSSVTVTTDPETGDVYINRQWGDTSGLNVTTPPAGEPAEGEFAENPVENTAAGNMAGGTFEDITGEDGIYHGEPDVESPSVPDSSAPSGSGADTSSSSDSGSGEGGTEKDSGGDGSDKNSDSDSSGSGSSSNNSSSDTSSSSGSSGQFPANPKNGDICYIDGVKYMYALGFGWGECGDGSGAIPYDSWIGPTGVTCPNASFG